MALEPGATYRDAYTGASLELLETAARSGGDRVAFRLVAPPGWSAGACHRHPQQREAMTVRKGALVVHRDGESSRYEAGERAVVEPGVLHTAGNGGPAPLELLVEFAPALRTDELFVTMFGGCGRRPPRFVPSALRSLIEARGFSAEIRYAWPRRLAAALPALAAAWAVSRWLRR